MRTLSPAGTDRTPRPATSFRLPLAAALVWAALGACASPSRSSREAGLVPAGDYFPLRAGAAWRFEKSEGHSRLLELGTPNDEGQFPLFVLNESDQRVPMARLSIEGDGAVVLRSPQGVQVLLREPVRAGATWEWEVSPDTHARQRAWIEAVEERDVGGEMRACVRVAFGPSRARVQERYVFARGVGWIAIERQLADGTVEALTLRAFTPGGSVTSPAPAAEAPAGATGG